MPTVSVTRLRIRSIRFMPAFALRTLQTIRQVRHAGGFLGGSLLPDRRLTFWTMTMWREQADMRRYVAGGAHLRAMPKLLGWCDEASVVRWEQDGAALPGWAKADERMRAEGRPSKVRHPGPDHRTLAFAPPRTSGSAAIRPTSTDG